MRNEKNVKLRLGNNGCHEQTSRQDRMLIFGQNWLPKSGVFVWNLSRKTQAWYPSSIVQAHSAVFPTSCLGIQPIFRSISASLAIFVLLILYWSCLAGFSQ